MTSENTPAPQSTECQKGFNYCFWAKLIVAIPALPLTAIITASFFDSMAMQIVAGGSAVALLIYAAIKIDQMPCLLKKVVDRQ